MEKKNSFSKIGKNRSNLLLFRITKKTVKITIDSPFRRLLSTKKMNQGYNGLIRINH